MNGHRRGADVLAQALARANVHNVFALSGNHIMPIFDAAQDVGIALFHTRHEGACVHMADAWARLTGEVGVALVTGGAGLGNAIGALHTSLAGETPVVLLSGHAPLQQLGSGAFQELRQVELAAPLVKASWMATSAAGLPADIARACRLARSGRPGPVHLTLPTDVVNERVYPGAIAFPDASDFEAARSPLGAPTARLILDTLAAADRPLVIAPPALASRAGRASLGRLADAIGVPVIAMESPRGVNDPSLGAFAEVLCQADLIVLAGKALDFTLGFGGPPSVDERCDWIVVDPDPALIARAAASRKDRLLIAAVADAASTIAALTKAAGGSRGDPGWLRTVEDAIAHRLPAIPDNPTSRHPDAMCRGLLPALQDWPDTVLVVDGGEIGQWAQAGLTAEDRLINGVAGAIGSSVPFAIAAKLARPDARALAVLGDGTMGFHLSEFDTATRYGLPFVAVVGNDARWNAEYQIQLRDYGPARAQDCLLAAETRYDLAAAALGGYGEFVRPGDDLPAAVERAFASGKPACVNVVIEGAPAPVIRRA